MINFIVWLVASIIVVDFALSQISSPSNVGVLTGILVLILWDYYTVKTKCFTKLFKRNETIK